MKMKNFKRVSTEKLNALLAVANEADKALIEQELARRAGEQQEAAPQEAEEQQEAAPQEAEEQQEAAPQEAEEQQEAAPQEAKKRLSDEELSALAESLKANVLCRCQAVPFGEIEWVNGYIAGVIVDKRASKVLYAIKTEDGRRFVKVHNSNGLKVFEERVSPVQAGRAPGARRKKLSGEELEAEMAECIKNVGKLVQLASPSGEEAQLGIIIAVDADKRVGTLLYRIRLINKDDESSLGATVHKVWDSKLIQIEDELTPAGEKLNAQYMARRERRAFREDLSLQERMALCAEDVKKAEEKLEKAKASLELKKARLEELKVAFEAEAAAAE